MKFKGRKNKQHITEPHELPGAEVETTESPAEPEVKRRQLVVVDVETTGLGDGAAVLEVAAVNVDTGEELSFVPYVDWSAFGGLEAKRALEINRYLERGVWRDKLDSRKTAEKYAQLREMLAGNVFAGSNPTFDSRLIAAQDYLEVQPCRGYGYMPNYGGRDRYLPVGRVWHHRLGDLAAYAAGKLDIDPAELPGLDAVCDALGFSQPAEARHTALGDALAAAECFRKLRGMQSVRGYVTIAGFDDAALTLQPLFGGEQ